MSGARIHTAADDIPTPTAAPAAAADGPLGGGLSRAWATAFATSVRSPSWVHAVALGVLLCLTFALVRWIWWKYEALRLRATVVHSATGGPFNPADDDTHNDDDDDDGAYSAPTATRRRA